MTTEEKKAKVAELAKEMTKEVYESMLKKIERAVESPTINIDAWEAYNKPMILPKVIILACLESEAAQYDAKGTSFEKEVKKEVKNLRYYI